MQVLIPHLGTQGSVSLVGAVVEGQEIFSGQAVVEELLIQEISQQQFVLASIHLSHQSRPDH